MKSFSTENGDVIIGDTIELVNDTELLRQKVERVMGTNLGEWSYDADEGIDFHVILTKNPDEAAIQATIENALKQIDETFVITEFSMSLDGRNRNCIYFKASNSNGEEVGGDYSYD